MSGRRWVKASAVLKDGRLNKQDIGKLIREGLLELKNPGESDPGEFLLNEEDLIKALAVRALEPNKRAHELARIGRDVFVGAVGGALGAAISDAVSKKGIDNAGKTELRQRKSESRAIQLSLCRSLVANGEEDQIDTIRIIKQIWIGISSPFGEMPSIDQPKDQLFMYSLPFEVIPSTKRSIFADFSRRVNANQSFQLFYFDFLEGTKSRLVQLDKNSQPESLIRRWALYNFAIAVAQRKSGFQWA